MSLCTMDAGRTRRLGLAATAVGLTLNVFGGLAPRLQATAPFHFVDGALLGLSLTLMTFGLIRGRGART
jgi:hypothetical protein